MLEPWITPSLFYRFLGKKHNEGVGMDSFTFCEALGATEANKVLRAHWDSWVTEEHIKELADKEVEIIRLPIGDWMYEPYEAYVGCFDGAQDKIGWLLDMADKYGIKVMLDMHGLRGSQNGYDNSGIANRTAWLSNDHFDHWSYAVGEWMGPWDFGTQSY